MQLRKGMKVRILPRQHGWEQQGPSYVDDMTELEGEIFTIGKICHNDWVHYKGYSWNMEWLAPVLMENE